MSQIKYGRGPLARKLLLSAMVATSSVVVAPFAHAQSNVDGYIYGDTAITGDQVVVENAKLGISRTVTAGEGGQFRVRSLPIGEYQVKLIRGGQVVSTSTVTVNVGVGSMVGFASSDATELGEITVTGREVAMIDFSQTEAVTVVNESQIDDLPVARDLTSVALLAPGTVQGDSAFGNLASFGGSSVAENAVYVNGFNVTDFRTGTGFTQVPFEFLSGFQVKTGGYGAEFGRSLGGVINTTTKRGSNDWNFGVNAYFEPDSMWEDPDSVHLNPLNPFPADADYVLDNRQDENETWNYNLFGGGAIIKDRLYVYGLVNLRDVSEYDDLLSRDRNRESDDPFYGAKVDLNIADGHLLELTYLSDERDQVDTFYDDDPESDTFGEKVGVGTASFGGKSMIARYTAQIGDLSASLMYGNGKLDQTEQSSTAGCPIAIDARSTGVGGAVGCWAGSFISAAEDERTAYRLDLEMPVYGFAGDHVFRGGIDIENNTSEDDTSYSGGIYYRYIDATPGSEISGTDGTVPADVNEMVRERNYFNGGSFDVNSTAFYIEDTWSVSETLTLYLGLRNESFDNKNAAGDSFIKIDNQLAPRLGLSWDAVGEGTSRFFANWGRYYLPVASNTNVRLAGGETFLERYYQCGADGAAEACAYGADGSPTNQGSQIGNEVVYSDGEIPPVDEILDRNIDPMYQDEIILGYQTQLSDYWAGGVRFIHRDLAVSIEDVLIDHALIDYAAANGITNADGSAYDSHPHAYVLTNPGRSMAVSYDFGDGAGLRDITLSAEELGYPKAQRYYNALEFFFERARKGGWFLEGSYTWSQSYGNSEGYVRSDNGQDDAGITTNFDTPGLTYGSYGYLPNDRRHKIKLWGGYEVNDQLTISANVLAQSGRPKNVYGDCPADLDPDAYGGECFFDAEGNVVPRGKAGTLGWLTKVDLGVRYEPIPNLKFGVDVFNVLNSQAVTEVNEVAIEDTDVQEDYNLPSAFQAPRYVRFSAEYQFGL